MIYEGLNDKEKEFISSQRTLLKRYNLEVKWESDGKTDKFVLVSSDKTIHLTLIEFLDNLSV
jgi:hypothetical protein